ncbi:MAG: PspC family transcriptional regulator [Bacteroidetes bacterium]|nr:PspC family transcriptional regulator [Bacteroidota bacterium]
MHSVKFLMEKRLYGVCSYLGGKMGISSERIRLYFIYASCFTLGSPFLFYLFVAFWMNIRSYMKEKRHSVWDI